MRFCTAINCMDGRVQLPVIEYLRTRFDAEYVDTITEPGPNAVLAEGSADSIIQSIERRLRVSLEHHHSVGIAVVGHHGCAGNPSDDIQQKKQTLAAVEFIRRRFKAVPVIGLWVDEAREVTEISDL